MKELHNLQITNTLCWYGVILVFERLVAPLHQASEICLRNFVSSIPAR
jgi:hypothetical protein